MIFIVVIINEDCVNICEVLGELNSPSNAYAVMQVLEIDDCGGFFFFFLKQRKLVLLEYLD